MRTNRSLSMVGISIRSMLVRSCSYQPESVGTMKEGKEASSPTSVSIGAHFHPSMDRKAVGKLNVNAITLSLNQSHENSDVITSPNHFVHPDIIF